MWFYLQYLLYKNVTDLFNHLTPFSLQRQRIQAIETEIEGYKKSISKAQEQNEKITLLHNKIEADISVVKKQIGISRTKTEALKTEYSTYTRTLHDTEQKLSKVQMVGWKNCTQIDLYIFACTVSWGWKTNLSTLLLINTYIKSYNFSIFTTFIMLK